MTLIAGVAPVTDVPTSYFLIVDKRRGSISYNNWSDCPQLYLDQHFIPIPLKKYSPHVKANPFKVTVSPFNFITLVDKSQTESSIYGISSSAHVNGSLIEVVKNSEAFNETTNMIKVDTIIFIYRL